MSPDTNRAVVERFDALMGASDLGELDQLCTPDMRNHSLATSRPSGLAGTREFLTTSAHLFGDSGWNSLVVVADADYVVQYGRRGGTWRGGDLFGYELTPGPYERDVVFMYRLANGRIAERWAVRDDLTMLRQLGAVSGR